MPIRVNPVPRPLMQHFGESSALRSERDSDDVSRMHIKVDALAKQVQWLNEAVKRQGDIINRLRLRKGGVDDVAGQNPCPAG